MVLFGRWCCSVGGENTLVERALDFHNDNGNCDDLETRRSTTNAIMATVFKYVETHDQDPSKIEATPSVPASANCQGKQPEEKAIFHCG